MKQTAVNIIPQGTGYTLDSVRKEFNNIYDQLNKVQPRTTALEQVTKTIATTIQTVNTTIQQVSIQRKYQQDLYGTKNGSNATFSLPDTPRSGTERIFLNGQSMKRGTWYTISGKYITIIGSPIPDVTDSLDADYDI